MSTVIKIENLSKKYVIGHQKEKKYTALRDVMMHKFRGIGQRLRHPLSPNKERTNLEDFWALKDINLEIKQGDRVGIIGKNGAGKSTLLKILSRITEPTTGRITINGRVASLLEVGTGFHPELTGRENIFLNGAILGMSRVNIKTNFDAIVAFAEVEKFLDTPVKRYSSGMYVRLAFAVAAHLDPEILVVDEILAVGDAEFQKKCLRKMQDVGKEGRTVLFVSHNMGAITRICSKAAYLVNGEIKGTGNSASIVDKYLHGESNKTNEKKWVGNNAPGNNNVKLLSVKIKNHKGETTDTIDIDRETHIEILIKTKISCQTLGIAILVKNTHGEPAIHSSSLFDRTKEALSGTLLYRMRIPPQLLNIGQYTINVSSDIPNKEIFFNIENILSFEIVPLRQFASMYHPAAWKGIIAPESVKWDVSTKV